MGFCLDSRLQSSYPNVLVMPGACMVCNVAFKMDYLGELPYWLWSLTFHGSLKPEIKLISLIHFVILEGAHTNTTAVDVMLHLAKLIND